MINDSSRLSRRQLLKVGLGTAIGLGLATTGLDLPGFAIPQADAAAPYEIYTMANAAQHQARYDDLSRRGFRMISLCVHGDPADARYAAVWVQRPGPAQWAVHNVGAAEYGATSAKAEEAGYAPVIVSATGPAKNARFAGIFEQQVQGGWQLYTGMTEGNADSPENGIYRRDHVTDREGRFIRSLAIYGDTAERRYAAIWHTKPSKFSSALRASLSVTGYQQVFDGVTSQGKSGYRPSVTAIATDLGFSGSVPLERIAAVFTSDQIGPWAANHNMTAQQFDNAVYSNRQRGLFPIQLQAGGVGSNKRFAAIFADYNAVMAGKI